MQGRAAGTCSAVLVLLVVAAVNLVGGIEPARQAAGAVPEPEIVSLPAGWQLNGGPMGPMRTELALSPDGTSVVFSANPDGKMENARLYRRVLDRRDATIVPGTPAGVCMPVFSPDGRWIAYWADKQVFKVPVDGGSPVALSEVPARPFGMSWAPDGRIFLGQAAGGLQYVPASGGTPQALTRIDPAREQTHRLPHVMPGGKGLLFTAMRSTAGVESRLEWLSLESGERRLLVNDAGDGRYLATGHLAFVRKGALMVVPFDLARLQPKGAAVTLVPRLMHAFNTIMRDMNSGAGQYAVSESGALLWVTGGVVPDYVPAYYWVDRAGQAQRLPALDAWPINTSGLSADGRRLAFTAVGLEKRGVFVYDVRQNRTTRVMEGQTAFVGPRLSPDGKHIAFSWDDGGHYQVWLAPADGSAKPRRLAATDAWARAAGWTPDGKSLVYVEGEGPQSGMDIKVFRVADGQITPFAATKAAEAFPELSPDGRWLAYASNETGRNEIYVRSFPDGKRTLQITSEGATAPLWGPDGRELFYFDVAFNKLSKVDLTAGETVSVGGSRALFEFTSQTAVALTNYSITPDGRRFLIHKRSGRPPALVTQMNLERRWFDRVKRIGGSS